MRGIGQSFTRQGGVDHNGGWHNVNMSGPKGEGRRKIFFRGGGEERGRRGGGEERGWEIKIHQVSGPILV
jgi:hypothetical protein